MLIKIIEFQVDLQYQEGSKMDISDAISRFNTHDNDDAKSKAKHIADLVFRNLKILLVLSLYH